MLHGAAMIQQWDSKGNLAEYGAAYVTTMRQQWSMAYSAQRDNNGTMVQHGTTSI